MPHAQTTSPRWALILGASSGFGEACARALAGAGYDIAGVHLDRKGGLAHVEEIKAAIQKLSIEQKAEIARWFHGWTDDEWDRQMKDDAAADKAQENAAATKKLLDSLAQLLGENLLFHYSKINMKPPEVGSV